MYSCQQLYEKHKLITYPRSDCRYLPKEHLKQVKAVSQAVAVNEPELALAVQQADTALISRAWNDGKVDAHHAIIPTEKRMPAGRLSVAEQRLYQMIARQYLAQFYPPFCYRDTLAMDIVVVTFRVTLVRGYVGHRHTGCVWD